MQNAISILGSTGSIGRQTLEAAELLKLEVRALSAGKNTKLLEEQVRRWRPAVAAVSDETAARDFAVRVGDTATQVISGDDCLIEAALVRDAETVVTAVSGTCGLTPTLAAIGAGRRIALANKETLICAGELVMKTARARGADIIPVDSEHSAIFQCLDKNGNRVKKIILTASGGPFRGFTRDALFNVTAEMALKHPNWNMGRKVTIDSASLMNKGFEFIEAMYLFSMPPDKIKVIIHPQSVIHSMVEYEDNSILAQLAVPDMRLPIQYALTYPERFPSLTPPLDFSRIGELTFYEPDCSAFPCLSLALDAARRGGTACAALCGADDVAVELFLAGKIGFIDIFELCRDAVENTKIIREPNIDDILAAISAAKRFVFERSKQCTLQ